MAQGTEPLMMNGINNAYIQQCVLKTEET